MEIILIKVAFSKDGLHFREEHIECTERDKSYLFYGNRFAKSKMMKMDSMFHNTIPVFRIPEMTWRIYCLPNQKAQAIEIAKAHVITHVNNVLAQAKQLELGLTKIGEL